MNSSAYNKYLAAIKAANGALGRIQKELIARYGLSDAAADYLIRQFRYYPE